jgi:hypothetical protein
MRLRRSAAALLLALLLAGCGGGSNKMSASALEAFLAEQSPGTTDVHCARSAERRDWDYVCTYSSAGERWQVGLMVGKTAPEDGSGPSRVGEPLAVGPNPDARRSARFVAAANAICADARRRIAAIIERILSRR